MNATEIMRHEGTVVESFHDLTISVIIPTLAESAFEDIHPEAVGPLRWRPAQDSKVTIYQRVGPLRPDIALTWAGCPSDPNESPAYLEAGKVHLISEEGRVVDSWEDPDDPDDPLSPVKRLIGRFDADSPLLVGTEYKVFMEAVLDSLIKLAAAVETVASDLQTHVHGGVTTGPGISAIPTVIAGYISAESDADTAGSELTTSKASIDDHLSDYVFTSKTPAPE